MAKIGRVATFVADGGGEELEEAERGVVAGAGRRHDQVIEERSDGPRRRYSDELVHAG
jgi:hypothetical protein